jgi:hypothetical protein
LQTLKSMRRKNEEIGYFLLKARISITFVLCFRWFSRLFFVFHPPTTPSVRLNPTSSIFNLDSGI